MGGSNGFRQVQTNCKFGELRTKLSVQFMLNLWTVDQTQCSVQPCSGSNHGSGLNFLTTRCKSSASALSLSSQKRYHVFKGGVHITGFLTPKVGEWKAETDAAGWGAISGICTEGYTAYAKCWAALYWSLQTSTLHLTLGRCYCVPAYVNHMWKLSAILLALESLMILQLQA
jgi:hypothetical protein